MGKEPQGSGPLEVGRGPVTDYIASGTMQRKVVDSIEMEHTQD